jgi:hypothetical protein
MNRLTSLPADNLACFVYHDFCCWQENQIFGFSWRVTLHHLQSIFCVLARAWGSLKHKIGQNLFNKSLGLQAALCQSSTSSIVLLCASLFNLSKCLLDLPHVDKHCSGLLLFTLLQRTHSCLISPSASGFSHDDFLENFSEQICAT